jgi:hypothetical protein
MNDSEKLKVNNKFLHSLKKKNRVQNNKFKKTYMLIFYNFILDIFK